MKHVPYTYLIGWSKINVFYYGVRYSKKANPSDLWKTYFTSSKLIPEYREKYGEPDVIQVRRTFKTKEQAIKWERTVLRRMCVASDNFLNQRWSDYAYPESLSLNENELDARAEMSREAGRKGASKISKKAKERWNNPEFRAKQIERCNTPENRKMLSERNIKAFQREDVKARHLAAVNTPEYKAKQGADSKERMKDPANRKRLSESLKSTLASPEKRKAMSEAAKASTAKRLETRRLNKLKQTRSLSDS